MNELQSQNEVSILQWWEVSLDVASWSKVENLSSKQAAMLLCGFNPNRQKFEEAITYANNEIGRGDIQRLLNVLEGASTGSTRTLDAWRCYAVERELKMHPWVALWAPTKGAPLPVELAPEIHEKAIPRTGHQDRWILAEIVRQGHKPLCVPIAASGKRGLKADVREALLSHPVAKTYFASARVFNTAWQRLRDNCEIVDAGPCPVDPI